MHCQNMVCLSTLCCECHICIGPWQWDIQLSDFELRIVPLNLHSTVDFFDCCQFSMNIMCVGEPFLHEHNDPQSKLSPTQ